MANNKAYIFFLLISSLTIFNVNECFGFGLADDPLGRFLKRGRFFLNKSSSEPVAEKYTASLTVDTEHSPKLTIDTEHSPKYVSSLIVDTEQSPKITLDTTKHSPVYLGAQDGLKEDDKIEALPGQPKHGVSFDQYSGYVTVDALHGRALFYYFVESPQNSSTNPLVLWLSGGPGCSSLASAMMEFGPFRVKPNGKSLYLNEYSLNNAANVIFLESPAGVGFSYSNTTSDYNLSRDSITAEDSYTFLVNWLERFPEYKTRDFYITGESYAGHYVPQLAQLILQKNKITSRTTINLKGIAIGNALIDDVSNIEGKSEFFWSHAFISDELYQELQRCFHDIDVKIDRKKCTQATIDAMDLVEDIYPYEIYAPLCSSTTIAASKKRKPTVDFFDPCSSVNYTLHYLNIPRVQKALHANVTAIPHPWDSCSMLINEIYQYIPTVLPVIKELMNSEISVWLYSGDTDGVVPVTDTKYVIKKLATPVLTKWYPWYNQKEVGGYAVQYENLTFVTVRGAGHFVPSYQPSRALALFKSFLEGKLPPAS